MTSERKQERGNHQSPGATTLPACDVHEKSLQVPELDALKPVLIEIFGARGYAVDPFEIISRERNVFTSTFPAEIIKCRLGDGVEQTIIGKYQVKDLTVSYGHRGGVPYEATVYREVLQHAHVPTVRFFGAHSDARWGQVWLFLEYLENSVRAHKVEESVGLFLCARWIGRFHAENEQQASKGGFPLLISYDEAYYRGWANRTRELVRPSDHQFSWLDSVCRQFEKCLEVLLSDPKTVIHGEFYPKNILARNGGVYPVDWESAAIATGEIDLAFLTEGWEPAMVQQCEREYQLARWPAGADATFSRRMKAARIYGQLRWLGDPREYRDVKARAWRLEVLRREAQDFGLI